MEEWIRLLMDYQEPERLCRPSPAAVEELVQQLRQLLLPGYFGTQGLCASRESYVSLLAADVLYRLESLVLPLGAFDCLEFMGMLPKLRQALALDLQAFLAGDPAAAGEEEVVVSYPGFLPFWCSGWPIPCMAWAYRSCQE